MGVFLGDGNAGGGLGEGSLVVAVKVSSLTLSDEVSATGEEVVTKVGRGSGGRKAELSPVK